MDYPTIHRIKSVFGFPEFVKESEINSNPKCLWNQEYADPTNRQYPCDSATNTYVSNALFWESALDKSASVDVGRNLLKMAKFWGIFPSVQDNILRKVANAATLSQSGALPDEAYALVYDDTKLYPVVTADLVKESSAMFYEDRTRIPMELRKSTANVLLKKAEEFKIKLQPQVQEYLEKAAGLGISTSKQLAAAMKKRAAFLSVHAKMNKEANAMEKHAAAVADMPLSKELCEKVSEILNKSDEEGKLYQFYGDKLELPEEECFSILYKHAQEEASKFVKLATGTVYNKEDLEKIGFDLFALTPQHKPKVKNIVGAFNKEAVATTLRGMNKTDSMLVEKVLDLKGVQPAKLKFDPSLFN